MRPIIKNTLAVITCSCALFQVLPAMAANNSGQLQPVRGKALVYKSYVDNNDCYDEKQTSNVMQGGGAYIVNAYFGDQSTSKPSPIDIACKTNYVMVQMTSQTGGQIITVGVGGGTIYNDSSVKCCRVKSNYMPVNNA